MMLATGQPERVTFLISIDLDLYDTLKNATHYGKAIDPSGMINAILRHYLSGIANEQFSN